MIKKGGQRKRRRGFRKTDNKKRKIGMRETEGRGGEGEAHFTRPLRSPESNRCSSPGEIRTRGIGFAWIKARSHEVCFEFCAQASCPVAGDQRVWLRGGRFVCHVTCNEVTLAVSAEWNWNVIWTRARVCYRASGQVQLVYTIWRIFLLCFIYALF